MTPIETLMADSEFKDDQERPELTPELIGYFQYWWRKKPNLRRLIAASVYLTDKEIENSARCWTLRELERTPEWRQDAAKRMQDELGIAWPE